MIVTLPTNEAQVLEILDVCRELAVPIVPRGAGTGLSGGALPIHDGVVLSTARLNRIVRVDAYARTAVVQPGVRNLAISEAAAQYGLYYAPDPSSQIACTIGGNVAENSGGVHCLKYGLTVHNVLRVRVATIDGEIIELGSEALDAPGLDLLAVFIGSEGMLGIVTEVTVKLVPKPAAAQVIMASFGDVVTGGNAVASVIAAGIIPAGLEMMDRTSVAHGRAFRARRLRHRRRRHPAVRGRRHAARSGRGNRTHDGGAAGGRRQRDRGVADRSRAHALLVRPQERLPGGGPHLARLLLHGRHHPAQAPGASADRDRADGNHLSACAAPTCSTRATATCTR
jgi:FAD/FMN-containing dehydrogenase